MIEILKNTKFFLKKSPLSRINLIRSSNVIFVNKNDVIFKDGDIGNSRLIFNI